MFVMNNKQTTVSSCWRHASALSTQQQQPSIPSSKYFPVSLLEVNSDPQVSKHGTLEQDSSPAAESHALLEMLMVECIILFGSDFRSLWVKHHGYIRPTEQFNEIPALQISRLLSLETPPPYYLCIWDGFLRL
jgi:hypothetical protein